ncbi:MAG: type IV pilus secretin PilQ [Candidatus Acidiferrales bacterium]
MKNHWPGSRLACLIFVFSAAVATVWAGAGTLPTSNANTPAISAVHIAQSGREITVRVDAGAPLVYQQTRLENPPRLVLDFSNARLMTSNRPVANTIEPVRGIRLGQSTAGAVRLVIDLDHVVADRVQTDASGLTITFSSDTAESDSHRASASPAAVNNVPQMSLPTWLTTDASSFAAPTNDPPAPAPQQAAAQTQSASQVQSPSQQAAPPFAVVEAKLEPGDPTPIQGTGAGPMAPAEKKYTGEPISVNLKDVDLKDFFRLIHEISGLNIVVDPAVHGTVTLVLDEVPWDQALDIVLQNNDLTSQIDGNVLRIATQDTVRKEAEAKRTLANAQAASVELVTVTRVLSYAKAATMATTLKRFLSPRGDILADDRSNSLIIRDVPAVLPTIDDLLRQLDRKSQQVEIEARVVEASRAFARDIGSQLGLGIGYGAGGSNVIGGGSGVASTITHTGATLPITAAGTTDILPLLTNFPAVAPTSGIAFARTAANYALDYVITAMENKGVGKLLSEPEGVTQNNEKLTVKQGEEIPIQTTINDTISVQYVDAVLKLEVTPQITADGTVFLDVDVENTQIDNGIPRISGIPALDTQSATTKVLIRDGGTVVIGGVIVSSQENNVNQVPIIGSIPLIGHLFKETSVSVSSQELLFFVTPRILPD